MRPRTPVIGPGRGPRGHPGWAPGNRTGSETDPEAGRTDRTVESCQLSWAQTHRVKEFPKEGQEIRASPSSRLAGLRMGWAPGCWRIGRVGSPSEDDAVKDDHLGRK